ncbi:MAG: hypothetical protein QM699_04035 [Amaricoccus sp.]|uniref:hypothetical protein n=1 Tax=Amaricoccus sp. TaxID=1872485 RepID=UPI0039E6C19A
MADSRNPGETSPDETSLEPWFAAARAERTDPPLALLAAILDDAVAVGAGRAPMAPVLVAEPEPDVAAVIALEPDAPRRRLGALGWKAMTALAACALLGFWIGIAGRVTIEDGAVWSGARAVAADTVPDDPVGAFFDLASAEG